MRYRLGNQMKAWKNWRTLITACVTLIVLGARDGTFPASAPPSMAQEILSESGFHGGLIVVLEPRAADDVLCFAQGENVLVHGLLERGDVTSTVRDGIRKKGSYGRVSVMDWEGGILPYADGMVNLLVCQRPVENLKQDEIDRVLAPNGVAWTWQEGQRVSHRKPRPAQMDEWTHSRYDATCNAVSKDKLVGPPRFVQWEALPRWNRGVKTSSLVAAGGRIFFILDDSSFLSRERTWSLIARDAYNGIQLWRHELAGWEGARGGKKVGPAQVHRRLVAVGEKVYATLGEFYPVSVIDAATGQVIKVLKDTEKTEEFLVANGILVALVNPNDPSDHRRGEEEPLRIVAADAETGKTLWIHQSATLLPLTLASNGDQVVYHDGKAIQSLDLRTGASRWNSPPTGQKVEHRASAHPDSPGAEKSTILLAPQFAPTLILYEDVVAFAGGCQINVVSAKDGKELWRAEYPPSNYSVPVDLFGFEGLLWGPDTHMNMWRPLNDHLELNAYDPLTGEIRERLKDSYGFRFQHHRCHPIKAVDKTVLMARAGIEFFDTETAKVTHHHWTRGSCYYGIMPANALLYVPPHDCACYIRTKLSGFMALQSAATVSAATVPKETKLQKGPAYGEKKFSQRPSSPEDWPTYRHDMARSGKASTSLDTELLLGWQTEVRNSLTSPVIAEDRLYVASTDSHQLYCLDADTGETLWQYDFEARIDSPPTIYQGIVLSGCRDGSVHALRASDGTQAWRFRAAPDERLICCRGQLESAWPVPGSLLILNDTVTFAAGKSSYVDGGIYLYGLDPHTGAIRVERTLNTRHEDGSETLDEEGSYGFLNDILASDGKRIFMRHQVFDEKGQAQSDRIPHLHGPDGFLSEETTPRLLWTYAPVYTSPHQGAFYDRRLSRTLFPTGRILVEGRDEIYGYGQNHYEKPRPDPGGTYALFCAFKKSEIPLDLTAREYRELAVNQGKSMSFRWWKRIPIQVWAMVLAEDVLFVTGPMGNELNSEAALDGEASGRLLAVSRRDGAILAEMILPSTPVWDGLAAARGKLYLSTRNGQVLCLWSANSGRPGTPLSAESWGKVLPPVKVEKEEGLVGHWRFDEGQGLLARDSSGQGHDAEVAGHWEETEFGPCLATDGAPGAAMILDAPHLRFGNNDFTLALWVKIDAYDVRILGKEAFPQNWWVINVVPDGRAELVLGEGRGDGKSVRALTSEPLPKGDWVHLAAVVDRKAGTVHWYVDGKLDTTHSIPQTMTEGLHAEGKDIAIPSHHKPFPGFMGDFRIYRRALDAKRMRELFEEKRVTK